MRLSARLASMAFESSGGTEFTTCLIEGEITDLRRSTSPNASSGFYPIICSPRPLVFGRTNGYKTLMNRRKFLETSSTAALALTAASYVPTTFAAADKPKRVGLIGPGWYGKCDLFR